jgi:hypothetical protein
MPAVAPSTQAPAVPDRPRSRRNEIWCRRVAERPAPVSEKAAVISQKLALRSACAVVQEWSRARRRPFRARRGGVAVRLQSHRFRRATHEQRHRRHGRDEDDQPQPCERAAPAAAQDQPLGEGNEDHAAHRNAGGGDAQRLAAASDEPTRDRRVARQPAERGGAESDRRSHHEIELEQRTHAAQQPEPGRHGCRTDQLCRSRAPPVDDAADDR